MHQAWVRADGGGGWCVWQQALGNRRQRGDGQVCDGSRTALRKSLKKQRGSPTGVPELGAVVAVILVPAADHHAGGKLRPWAAQGQEGRGAAACEQGQTGRQRGGRREQRHGSRGPPAARRCPPCPPPQSRCRRWERGGSPCSTALTASTLCRWQAWRWWCAAGQQGRGPPPITRASQNPVAAPAWLAHWTGGLLQRCAPCQYPHAHLLPMSQPG